MSNGFIMPRRGAPRVRPKDVRINYRGHVWTASWHVDDDQLMVCSIYGSRTEPVGLGDLAQQATRAGQGGPCTANFILTVLEPLYVARALAAGARGCVSKNISPDELLAAIQEIGGGGRHVERELAQMFAHPSFTPATLLDCLSPRDIEILRLLTAGKSLSEVAEALGLSYKTVSAGKGRSSVASMDCGFRPRRLRLQSLG
jgi:hypothetical protein